MRVRIGQDEAPAVLTAVVAGRQSGDAVPEDQRGRRSGQCLYRYNTAIHDTDDVTKFKDPNPNVFVVDVAPSQGQHDVCARHGRVLPIHGAARGRRHRPQIRGQARGARHLPADVSGL